MNTRKGWVTLPCSRCGGGGMVSHYSHNDFEGAIDCPDCKGNGGFWVHIKSGCMAEYPGGPFIGRLSKKEIEALS